MRLSLKIKCFAFCTLLLIIFGCSQERYSLQPIYCPSFILDGSDSNIFYSKFLVNGEPFLAQLSYDYNDVNIPPVKINNQEKEVFDYAKNSESIYWIGWFKTSNGVNQKGLYRSGNDQHTVLLKEDDAQANEFQFVKLLDDKLILVERVSHPHSVGSKITIFDIKNNFSEIGAFDFDNSVTNYHVLRDEVIFTGHQNKSYEKAAWAGVFDPQNGKFKYFQCSAR